MRAAARLLDALGPESALAGGLAVSAWGYVRATRDVDVIVAGPLEEARQRLRRRGIQARLFRGDPPEGDFPCLRGTLDVSRARGVPFDVFPELVPLERDRTVELDVGGAVVRVVDLDTLIRLKLKAGGMRDVYDVALLLHLHPEVRERAVDVSRSNPAVYRRLVLLLADSRTGAQAREVKRQERARGKRPRRPSRPRS